MLCELSTGVISVLSIAESQIKIGDKLYAHRVNGKVMKKRIY